MLLDLVNQSESLTRPRASLPTSSLPFLYRYSKAMSRISTKNQVTIPVAVLEEVGLRPGERVTIEGVGDGELRVRRSALSFEGAFGVLTGMYPPGYLDRIDAEDAQR